ncbi:unnamed protein product [Rhizoctonia solani]|uniref:C3H1-type domain-containing protein n=1 Tax=Rhizoctonia solani TaxID=456999 RepID=A0A8H3HES9_9AGAM|nr:unnamed protein product [Rhizoctonia solani]
MNVHTHPALAGFDDMQDRQRRHTPVEMSAGDLAELTREEHRAKFKHTKLCSFYQKGQCTRTFDACAFLHTDDPEMIAKLGGVPANAPNPHNRPAHADPHVNPRVNSLTGRPRPRFPPGSRIMGIGVPKRTKMPEGDPSEVETKRTVCRFYSSGMCEYGKECRFLHIVPEPVDRVQASPKANIDTLCRNYPGCAYGDRCDFKHIEVNGMRPADSPFSTASALPPSISARASPAVISRPLVAEPTPAAPPLSLGERLGLLGERAGSSVIGDRTSRKELIRTASFGELPRRETGLLEERRPSLLDERRSSLMDERRSSLLSSSSLLSESRSSLLSDRGPLTRGASYNGTDTYPSPLARSSSLSLAVDRPNSAFGSLLGLGLGLGANFERAHASQPHTRTHTPIPRAPSPSPTHIGIPPSRIVPHPATVLAPGANGTLTAPGSGANTPLIRTLPPPGNELSGTGWRVASPLPPHISNEIQANPSAPGSPLGFPNSPLANAFGDGFFSSVPAPPPERKSSGLALGLGLTGMPGNEFDSDGEEVLPTMSYEDFADGFTTDHEHDHEHDDREQGESEQGDDEQGEKPRGYKTLPCKFFNPLLGRDCPSGDECNFIHDKLLSNNGAFGLSGEGKMSAKESMHPLFRTRECKYWAAGRCNQGDECPFKHTYGDDVEHGLETQSQSQDSRENPYWRTRPCKWYQQGQCLRGDNCNYLHTLDTPAPVLCKFYPTPGCRNGAECPFVHTDDPSLFAQHADDKSLFVQGEKTGSEASGSELEHGGYGTVNGVYVENGFGPENGGYGGENGGYGVENGGYRVENPGYGVENPGFGGADPGYRGENPGYSAEHGQNGFGNGMFIGDGANGLFGGNGLYGFHGYTYQRPEEKVVEDEDSDDDVIFEPMRSTGGVEARAPGGLSMLLSGLALNGHAQAQAQAQVTAHKAN